MSLILERLIPSQQILLSLLQFALLLRAQLVHQRVNIARTLANLLSQRIHLRLLLKHHPQRVMLLLVLGAKGLQLSLVHGFQLLGVHPVQLSHLLFFKLDGPGALLDQFLLLLVVLGNFCL